jgi:hypothetical protein
MASSNARRPDAALTACRPPNDLRAGIAAADRIPEAKRQAAQRPCTQCGSAAGTVNQASICDPGEEPITVWLHRECEAAFLRQLDSTSAYRERQKQARGAP